MLATFSWLMLPGHLPGSGHFLFKQPKVKWALTQEWVLAQDTTVILYKHINPIRNNYLHVYAIAGAMHAPFIIKK